MRPTAQKVSINTHSALLSGRLKAGQGFVESQLYGLRAASRNFVFYLLKKTYKYSKNKDAILLLVHNSNF